MIHYLAAGLLKVRAFRPFPAAALCEAAARARALVVVDRNVIYGAGGALYREVQCALAEARLHRPVRGVVAGLGGRDVTPAQLAEVVEEAGAAPAGQAAGGSTRWLGLKEELL